MLSRSKLQYRHRLSVNPDLREEGIHLSARMAEAAPAKKRIAEPEAWAAEAVRTVYARAARAGAVELLLVARGLI
jgi:hypothetical protein